MWDTVLWLLSQPWLQGIAAVVTIGFTAYKARRVFGRLSAKALSWASTKRRQIIKRTCGALGIVTMEDFENHLASEELRRELAEQPHTAQSVPTKLERMGVRVDIEPSITKYLGRTDPIHMDSNRVNAVIQGPFCMKCSYTLIEWNGGLGEYVVEDRCPKCKFQWWKATKVLYRDKFKKEIYQHLDAEFRTTGRIAPTD